MDQFREMKDLSHSHRFRNRSNGQRHVSREVRTTWGTRSALQTTTVEFPAFFGTSEETIDRKHTGYPLARKLIAQGYDNLRGLDYGGPFFSRKLISEPPSGSFTFDRTYMSGLPPYELNVRSQCEGYRWPCSEAYNAVKGPVHELAWTDSHAVPTLDLLAYGASAISDSIPTIPPASLAVTLGELREGLPRLPGSILSRSGKAASGSASEYLNFQFGVLPTIADVKSLIDAAKNSEEFLAQLHRDEGRIIRRRRVLLDAADQTVTRTHSASPHPYAYRYNDTVGSKLGLCTHTTKVRRKVWFSGAFQYRFPRVDSWLEELIEFDRVYGVIPNAAAAWELIPWSWLVDWFSNVGDVVSNISYLGRDGLMMRWGYIMAHTTTDTVYTNGGFESRVRRDVKQRLRASPFGFGLKPRDLSPKQLAILASLGISRMSI